MNHRHSRRTFLSALGALSWASDGHGKPQSTSQKFGRSQKTGHPLRFVGVYLPHGCAYEYFPPQGEFDFSYEHAILAPFEDEKKFGQKYKRHLTIVDGVDLSAGLLVGTVGHEAPRVILTGSGADGRNSSLDQYLAVEKGLGRETLFTSLVLGIGNDQSGLKTSISYGHGGSPLPKTIDPSALFHQLFGQTLSGKAAPELARQRKLGRSVLDFVLSDLSRLSARAPRDQRAPMDQHLTALRDIEKRLTRPPPACELPPAPPQFESVRAYGGGEPYFEEITNLMMDLMVRALACDLTRFSTLFLADLSRSKRDTGLPDDIHQGVAHTYQARKEGVVDRPETWQALSTQNRDTMGQLARLAQKMDEAGILDDSLVLASSDMGNPAHHSSTHVPTLLLGSAGGVVSPGRFHRLGPTEHIPNNRILVSLCNAFGVQTDRFGDSAESQIVTGRFDPILAPHT